jgi:hypothetical protein
MNQGVFLETQKREPNSSSRNPSLEYTYGRTTRPTLFFKVLPKIPKSELERQNFANQKRIKKRFIWCNLEAHGLSNQKLVTWTGPNIKKTFIFQV